MKVAVPVLNLIKGAQSGARDSRATSQISKQDQSIGSTEMSGFGGAAYKRGQRKSERDKASSAQRLGSASSAVEDPRTVHEKANLRFSNKPSVAEGLSMPVRQQNKKRYQNRIAVPSAPVLPPMTPKKQQPHQ